MKPAFYDKNGARQEVTLDASIYREAHENNITVPQLLERKFETDAAKYGSVLEQLAESSGLITRGDKQFGLRAPSIADVLEGRSEMVGGVMVRDAVPASRILFPAVVLEVIENQLATDYASQPAIFDSMVALDDTIAGSKFEQAVLNFSKPEAARSQGISQGALPSMMLGITAADVARKIPVFSIGIEITDEALKSTSLDFLTLALRRQVEVERDARVEGYIAAMVSGDADNGQSALGSVTSDSLHAATGAGLLSHTAWMKYLYTNRRTRQLSHVICDLATAMKIENREGKPTINTDDPNSPRIDTLTSMINPGAPGPVKIFLVDDGVVAADTIVGLDARYAIRRVRNSEAAYQASEQFVMKKTSQMRFDFGEIAYRLFDGAWSVMTISA